MTDIEIKQALHLPLSEHEKFKLLLEEFFQKMSIKTALKQFIEEEKYRGVYLKFN